VSAFIADSSSNAYEKQINGCSPRIDTENVMAVYWPISCAMPTRSAITAIKNVSSVADTCYVNRRVLTRICPYNNSLPSNWRAIFWQSHDRSIDRPRDHTFESNDRPKAVLKQRSILRSILPDRVRNVSPGNSSGATLVAPNVMNTIRILTRPKGFLFARCVLPIFARSR